MRSKYAMRCVAVAMRKTNNSAETQINMRTRTCSHMRPRPVVVADSAVANESSALSRELRANFNSRLVFDQMRSVA